MDLDKRVEMCLLLDFYGNLLTEKQKNIMNMYYEKDISLAEIGDIVGISRQAVRDALKTSENSLILFEEKLGFVMRHKVLKNKIDEIITSIDDVKYDILVKELKNLSNNL